MVTLTAILGVSTLGASRELSERALNERLRLAQALADHLDYVLKSNLVVLQEMAISARTGSVGANLEPLKGALREAYLRSIFTEGVFLLDRAGTLIWTEPEQLARTEEDFISLPFVRAALESGKPQVSNLTGQREKRIYAAVPIRDWSGQLMGVIGGALDPESPRFRSLLHPLRMGGTTYLDLVDGNGVVLVSTKAGRVFAESDHGRFLANVIQEKRPVVGACHSCHHENGLPEREIMAFAPLTFAPWGINIREAESETLAAAFTMERRLLSVGAATILVALLFAWGVARSVARPLGVLTDAARQITKGNLEQPIPFFGEDEVGQLAQSFDQMRVTLKDSMETIARWNRDLEARVQKRTRDLEALNAELQRKEEIQRELLKRVITAQEEERKRVARELHDETSQASAALLLSIDTSSESIPQEAREQLRRMRAMADRVLDSIHRLIFDLRPSMLDDLGLPSALQSSAESHLEPLGMDVSFEVLGRERRLEPEVETTLFRIGQEAIANIQRHAEAESVKITVEFGEKEVRLEIEDDGKGFDPGAVERATDQARGLGILGMRERAALLDGTLAIHSQPGMGVRIIARIPLSEGPHAQPAP